MSSTFEQFQRLDRLIETEPTTHERYMRLAYRMGQEIEAARALLYRCGVEGRWFLDPTQRRGKTTFTVDPANDVEVPFWPDVPKLTKKTPPSHCLYKLPGRIYKDVQFHSRNYGVDRSLELHGVRTSLYWGLYHVITLLLETAFYCPNAFATIVTASDDLTTEHAQSVFIACVPGIYRMWVETFRGADFNDDPDDENAVDEDQSLTTLAGQVADLFVAKKAGMGGGTYPGERDRIFLLIVQRIIAPSEAASVEEMQVGLMERVYALYNKDALDFIAGRMKHHLLGGAVQPCLPIPQPTTDSPHWGPHRAEVFEPKPNPPPLRSRRRGGVRAIL